MHCLLELKIYTREGGESGCLKWEEIHSRFYVDNNTLFCSKKSSRCCLTRLFVAFAMCLAATVATHELGGHVPLTLH